MLFIYIKYDLIGIFNNSWHPAKILVIFLTLEVSQIEISDNEYNELHLENIKLILVTLEVFHIDISGNEDKE